jgi:serine/threonine protein phosphatase PrpC
MKILAFITHKQAEFYADCQDRFGVNPDNKSIAVSDGMGSTWQQKIWAQLLVDTFTKSNNWLPTHDSIKPLCNTWRQTVEFFIQHLKDTNAPDNIIYRNERNLAEGKSAGATFVGIRFDKKQWNGSVLGDSCLIEWNGTEAKFHTSQDIEAFDSYPDYFDSNGLKQGKGSPKVISDVLDKGQYLLLVSDPFSDFLLEHNKQGDISDYMQQLLRLSSHDEFEALVGDWRTKGMHNDDTTLVIVEEDQSEQFSIQACDEISVLIETERKENEKQKDSSSEIDDSHSKKLKDQHDNEVETVEVGESPSLTPVDEEFFRTDFLTEYKYALQKKHPNIGEFKFKWTQKAIIDAVNVMFKKYSIFIK